MAQGYCIIDNADNYRGKGQYLLFDTNSYELRRGLKDVLLTIKGTKILATGSVNDRQALLG